MDSANGHEGEIRPSGGLVSFRSRCQVRACTLFNFMMSLSLSWNGTKHIKSNEGYKVKQFQPTVCLSPFLLVNCELLHLVFKVNLK